MPSNKSVSQSLDAGKIFRQPTAENLANAITSLTMKDLALYFPGSQENVKKAKGKAKLDLNFDNLVFPRHAWVPRVTNLTGWQQNHLSN